MDVRAPQSGRVVSLAEVPDAVFAAGMVGPGVALEPDGEGPVDVGSPVAGTLLLAKPHAFLVQGEQGAVLVHLGIDTIELRGQGFEVLARPGDALRAGDPVLRWSPGSVAAEGRSPLVVVIAMSAPPTALTSAAAVGTVLAPGDLLFTWEPAPAG